MPFIWGLCGLLETVRCIIKEDVYDSCLHLHEQSWCLFSICSFWFSRDFTNTNNSQFVYCFVLHSNEHLLTLSSLPQVVQWPLSLPVSVVMLLAKQILSWNTKVGEFFLDAATFGLKLGCAQMVYKNVITRTCKVQGNLINQEMPPW